MKKQIKTLTGPKVKVLSKLKSNPRVEHLSDKEIKLLTELEVGGLIKKHTQNQEDSFILSETAHDVLLCLN